MWRCTNALTWSKYAVNKEHTCTIATHTYHSNKVRGAVRPTGWFWVSFLIRVIMFRSRSPADQFLPNHLLASEVHTGPLIIVAARGKQRRLAVGMTSRLLGPWDSTCVCVCACRCVCKRSGSFCGYPHSFGVWVNVCMCQLERGCV